MSKIIGSSTLYKELIRILFLLIFLIKFSDAESQKIRVSYLHGQIKKHTPSLRFETPSISNGIELSYIWYTDHHTSGWQRYWRQPQIDVSMVGINFGDQQILGYAAGALAGIQFNVWKSKKWQITSGVGGGIAYLDKVYDYNTNHINTAISSHVNNITRIRLQANYNNMWSAGFNLYHFSNGSTSIPNSGINVFAMDLGVQFGGEHKQKPIIEYRKQAHVSAYKNQGIDILYTYGFNRDQVSGGPLYSIQSLAVGYFFAKNPFLRWHFAGEVEFNDTRYNALLNDFRSESEARNQATSTIVSLGGEMMFGNIGFKPKLGVYLPYPTNPGQPVYFKLETHYYPLGIDNSINPYVGISLKSHFAIAEYIGLQVGINI